MFHDILIPCRIGTYFLKKKRVLSFQTNAFVIKAILIEYNARSITIINSQTIVLKDLSITAQVQALKKITSSIGAYDEISAVLPSTYVVYKELQLPFIGRDSLEMVVPFEIEPQLPFTLDQAVIDFIITQEDFEKKQSKLLVAAVRKEDIDQYLELFTKAELTLQNTTIDIFALYETCKFVHTSSSTKELKKINFFIKDLSIASVWQKIHNKISKKSAATLYDQAPIIDISAKESQLFIDLGFDVTRVLYFQDTTLVALRIIPTGLSDIATQIAEKLNVAHFDVMQLLLNEQIDMNMQPAYREQIELLFAEIKRTMAFFEKQYPLNFVYPSKIWFSGFLTNIPLFTELAQNQFSKIVHSFKVDQIIEKLKIHNKTTNLHTSVLNLSAALSNYFNDSVNFLKQISKENQDSLLNKQLLSIILITVLSIGLTTWKSIIILEHKEAAYNASKKQSIQEIEQRMHLDLHGEKNLKFIIEKAEAKLKNDQSLWFSFTAQKQHSLLEYLQDLSVNIDRQAIGLMVKTMHLEPEKVTMSGQVKSFETLDIFEEELSELQILQLIDKPRELTFSIEFKPKIQGQKS